MHAARATAAGSEGFRRSVARDGFAVVRGLASPSRVAQLAQALADDPGASRSASRRGAAYAARNLLNSPAVREFCQCPEVRAIVSLALGDRAAPVRAILFDKVEGANWRVGWHQDLVIAVRQRVETPGFTAWSVKAGVPHVKPPTEVLAGMLTVRLHLDACGPDNGPLQVLPGSHAEGEIEPNDIQAHVAAATPVTCLAAAGDAVVMRPLLLHSSERATSPSHRRVLHVEFASGALPGGLRWPPDA